MKDYFVHTSGVVDPGAEIGNGTKIWHFSHVMGECKIGENCTLGQNVFVASGVEIGNNVKIQNNVSVYEGVILEDDVFLGPSMVFTNVINPRSQVNRRGEFQQTLVKRGGSIGANATIVCGITLGEYAFIGAGAVVTRDVPAYGLVYGNPGQLQGWMCSCGERLDFVDQAEEMQAACESCGAAYIQLNDSEIKPIKVQES
jgi:UDP-2-acetamido-3-amino-2,3-dideoxy-glucuronate N-acetyltransferase